MARPSTVEEAVDPDLAILSGDVMERRPEEGEDPVFGGEALAKLLDVGDRDRAPDAQVGAAA